LTPTGDDELLCEIKVMGGSTEKSSIGGGIIKYGKFKYGKSKHKCAKMESASTEK